MGSDNKPNAHLEKYNFCLGVIELKKNIEAAYLTLASRLFKIRKEQLFLQSWESFEDYLDEVKINKSVASRLISVYEKFVLEYDLEPALIASAGGWSNAYELSRIVTSKEDAVRWLEESSLLTPKDTKIKIREQKTGITQESCGCSEDWYVMKICRKCGKKIFIVNKDELNEEKLSKLQ